MTQAARPLRIAVIGAGLIGARHAAHVAAGAQTRLACVVDPTPAGEAVAQAHGAPWRAEIGAALAQDRPDGVIVATPNRLHVEHALAAIAAGAPALVEKPIADDAASARRLVEAAERAGVALLIGHHRRHNPLIQRAKAIIAEGRLGRLVAVHGQFWLKKPDDYFDQAWRREPGAGPLLINAIHDIDLLRHLCGEIVAVQAMASNARRGFAVEDTGAILLRFADGALGTLSVTDAAVAPWSWEQSSGENPAYPNAAQSCYLIAGERGALSIPRLELWTQPEALGWLDPLRAEREIAHAGQDPLAAQLDQFVRVIRGQEAPLVSGRDGLRTLEIIEAIRRAAASGAQVEVMP